MKTYKILKSYYGSELLEIQANSEDEALEIALNTEIDLDANLGEITNEIYND